MRGTPARMTIPLEGLGDGVGMHRLSAGVGEDPAVVVDADDALFGLLPRLPRPQDLHCGGVEVDGTAGVAGLAAGLVEFVGDGDEPALDRDDAPGQVDVAPA